MQPDTQSTAKTLFVRFLGKSVPYHCGMHTMRDVISRVQAEGESCHSFELLFLEHQDTITTTRQHGDKNLLLPKAEIEARGISVVETDRGGDVTFHGSGQLVGYLIVRINSEELVLYLRKLESALLQAMHDLGLASAATFLDKTGVWIFGEQPKKLIAIGVGVSKGVTRHGFALNITTDIERFTNCIVPCGLLGLGVTSLNREMPTKPSIQLICETIAHGIARNLDLYVRFEEKFDPMLSNPNESTVAVTQQLHWN